MDKRNSIILLSLLSVLFVSCGHERAVGVERLPYCEHIISDTASVEHSVMDSYSFDRSGTIAVIGPTDVAKSLTDYFMACDMFDNGDGKLLRDGLPDFSGETFAVYYDVTDISYDNYFEEGRENSLREKIVKHSIAALSDRSFSGVYSDKPEFPKKPSKLIVLPSSFSEIGVADIDSLLCAFGRKVMVVSPVRSMLEKIGDRQGGVIGIWAANDVLASGVYASLLAESGADDYVGFTPEYKGDAASSFIGFLDMYLASGNDKPLSAILIDDFTLAGGVDAIRSEIEKIRTFEDPDISKYRLLLTGDFQVINSLSAMAENCYRILRKDNVFTFEIAYPDKKEYMIVEDSAEGIRYVELD